MIDSNKRYKEFFNRAMGWDPHDEKRGPYPYQIRLATDLVFPELLDIPTGLGKTAAVVLAWLWHRRFEERFKHETPRRLVYCLPMRVLVEQTYENTVSWLDRLGMLAGTAEWEKAAERKGLKTYKAAPDSSTLSEGWAREQELNGSPIAVHRLMGGAERSDWVTWPERDAIFIGTQDMLISRALNRGYAAGRARWPMDFGLLNNDCLWVFDEVQLMDTSLATSLQLDAWRKSLRLRGESGFLEEAETPVTHSCRSLWMSATMARHWLDSAVDWQRYGDSVWNSRHRLEVEDHAQEIVQTLFKNKKTLQNQKNPVAKLEKPRTQENKVDKADADSKTVHYVDQLANAIIETQEPADGLVLVIVNTVERAVMLYKRLCKRQSGVEIHLIHSRFRPMEREGWRQLFAADSSRLRIIVSTQVVEAGVDVSAKALFTELAPWPSLVQRFGRCARRAGESGTIYWMDVSAHESTALPYTLNELTQAKLELEKQSNVGLESLTELKRKLDNPQSTVEVKNLFPYSPRFVPRDKDLFDLFDTTPDLTGADVDISRYIRDGDELDIQVFWREIEGEPTKHVKPQRRELCPVAFYRFRDVLSTLIKQGRVWRRNYRKGWETVSIDQRELIYPGQVFLLETSCGAYDEKRGWTGDPKDKNFQPLAPEPESSEFVGAQDENDNTEDGEPLSELPGWVKLSDHLLHVYNEMESIGQSLLSQPERELLKLAARWHDRGKAHECFEANLKPDFLKQAKDRELDGECAAKAPDGKTSKGKGRDNSKDAWRRDKPTRGEPTDKRRPGFRHELASALAILETLKQAQPDHSVFAWPEGLKQEFADQIPTHKQPIVTDPLVGELSVLSDEDFDLLLYLVACHHGKVRMSLRSSPDDNRTDVPDPCPPEMRQARGVRDCDKLPACNMPGQNGEIVVAQEVYLHLDPMELGLSLRYGRSWRDRMQSLLEHIGPFRLAYFEALLRAADWRASAKEAGELAQKNPPKENTPHDLDSSNTALASTNATGAEAHTSFTSAAQGGTQHGLRRRTSGSTNIGARTRAPHAATRHLKTSLGVISYTELAPHLAKGVTQLQKSIADGDYDNKAIDEYLFLNFHRSICGELTPDFAGRWRITNVVVGTHEPPVHFLVPQRMREYTRDLETRLQALPTEPDDLWLEALAFAEGRLLSIHPFTDFNGRVTRVFIDLLTRKLKLPDVDPTPDPGEPTDLYLAALRAADCNNWRPLMDIWRERFERGGGA